MRFAFFHVDSFRHYRHSEHWRIRLSDSRQSASRFNESTRCGPFRKVLALALLSIGSISLFASSALAMEGVTGHDINAAILLEQQLNEHNLFPNSEWECDGGNPPNCTLTESRTGNRMTIWADTQELAVEIAKKRQLDSEGNEAPSDNPREQEEIVITLEDINKACALVGGTMTAATIQYTEAGMHYTLTLLNFIPAGRATTGVVSKLISLVKKVDPRAVKVGVFAAGSALTLHTCTYENEINI